MDLSKLRHDPLVRRVVDGPRTANVRLHPGEPETVRVGDEIELQYHGKHYAGRVVGVESWGLRIKRHDGGWLSAKWDGIGRDAV